MSHYPQGLYTQAFETALDTVLSNESFLFSRAELVVFEKYRVLPYEARFLYVRLFLRKKAAWFRVDKIGYESDISDVLGACRYLWSENVLLAENETAIDGLPALVGLLSLEELKTLARDFQCKGNTKDKLVDSLLKLSRLQLGLQKSGSIGLDLDKEGRLERKDTLIFSRVSQTIGKLIRLNQEAVELFNRLHIVFYRSSDYNEKSLTTLILARISRRNFPRYCVDRQATIFQSRDSLMQYEASLKLKFEVDNIMELNTRQTKAGLDRVIEIFELVFEPWQALVLEEQDRQLTTNVLESSPVIINSTSRGQMNYYARRFTAGWVWTRLIFKAAVVFAKRHEYSREHQIWQVLLAQKIFRVGRRGEWYDRKALLEQHYQPTFTGEITEAQKRRSKRIALETCVNGLRDIDTHQIYHNALQRRIIRLENDLKFTKREKHDFSHVYMGKPVKRTISGVRLDERLTGKHSVWLGRVPDSQISVEELSLESYQMVGWKGFHSENSIVTTLFAMLFWDILFMSIPGVFQTEFQTAPLDLATDAFYPARASQINHRLAEIENGGYVDLLKKVDEEHREAETWCVGLKWAYALEDLIEISDCIGGTSLAQLCKLFAEEYGHRVGGIGDLCLWNPATRQCMFVEVKGPGDHLSETQIAWLEQMSLAGIRVEVCHVVEQVGTKDSSHVKRESSCKSESFSLSFSRETTLEETSYKNHL
ncbi:Putative uncharacterized protein [Taphrina deformans PYCC 5710]|uniref:Fanconi-associated nuclease n=1 Tax=Taphrina deformans (strain PYCC 5710 / ATCC 11124 / CBS 356.35 / IMI 108563 / JCM 9778 / NBRC 8474) TaxID=1097556 RepID=R4XBW4_TAPDE|nr:Putative uncharacterized protein [Taphrina deformans PYCC 5710]|eukprot:CCG83294.1 Putative uncharacterized protein [Taphrina deformans PYCC 5710]